MTKKTCYNCKHVQEANKDNVYQDITGKFIVCEKCNSFIDVEGNFE